MIRICGLYVCEKCIVGYWFNNVKTSEVFCEDCGGDLIAIEKDAIEVIPKWRLRELLPEFVKEKL